LVDHSDVGRIAIRIAGHRKTTERGRAVEDLDLRGELRRSVRLDKRADAEHRGAHAEGQRSVPAVTEIRRPHQRIAGVEAHTVPTAQQLWAFDREQIVRPGEVNRDAESIDRGGSEAAAERSGVRA